MLAGKKLIDHRNDRFVGALANPRWISALPFFPFVQIRLAPDTRAFRWCFFLVAFFQILGHPLQQGNCCEARRGAKFQVHRFLLLGRNPIHVLAVVTHAVQMID